MLVSRRVDVFSFMWEGRKVVAYINDDVISQCYHYHSIGIVIYPRQSMSIVKSPITDIQNDAMFEAGDTVHVPRPFWGPPAVCLSVQAEVVEMTMQGQLSSAQISRANWGKPQPGPVKWCANNSCK